MGSTIKLLTTIVIIILVSCHSEHDNSLELSNSYAQFFRYSENNSGPDTLFIKEGWNRSQSTKTYILVSDSTEAIEESRIHSDNDNITIIKTPVRKVVCMSTSHISFLSALEEKNAIVAVSGSRYVSDSTIKMRIENNTVKDIGYESSVNYELLYSLEPDIVFIYGISGEDNQYINKIRESGITVVPVGDYLEHHPLGKAEYIKFFSYFFDKEDSADSLFGGICQRYYKATERVKEVTEKPLILLNAPLKETWYIPGEGNYMTRLINDAGGRVLLSKRGESHSYAHSIEKVVKEAYEADLWLNPNHYKSLEELSESSPMFKEFPLLKKGLVFNNIKRTTPGGGSDFWENGVLEPDIILNDLINIIHPIHGNKKELEYYKLLE
jgi:iron complex transport system substrate-binding protein